jgi:hypothetical protein
MTRGVENRREPRFALRLPATLLRGKREPLRIATADVSVHGLFLVTDEPPPVRQLVKVEVELPGPSGKKLLFHGMVVYVRKAAEGKRPAGAGVQLMGVEGDLLKTWDEFLRTSAAQAQAQAPAAAPRRLERRGNEVRLVFRALRDLASLAGGELAKPERFIASDLALPVGMRLRVVAEHPDTGAAFPLDVAVRRRASEAGVSGVAVDFAPLDAHRRAAFAVFAGDHAHELDDEDFEIDDG